jgi:glucuronoarabinoxylan endo-1,4-beta-xylanase
VRYSLRAAALSVAGVIAATIPAAGTATASSGTPAQAAASAPAVTVDGGTRYQRIDGFGFTEAFQRSNILHGSQGLSAANQAKVLDLLFGTQGGAGFSILRLGIGSSSNDVFDNMESIEPASPGSPGSPPNYVWDGSDNSQVWLSQQAMRYGVRQIYADAWSAPGYMKTNGSDSGGGYLCGVTGTSCASGDWRAAYARMLAQYAWFYRQAGVPISLIGFLNEPGLSTTYASMLSNGTQAASFIPFLAQALRARGLSTRIACCDTEGWAAGQQDIAQILAGSGNNTAARDLAVATSHGYTSQPTSPLTTARTAWETEWANFDPWDPAWDDGTAGDGYTWAGNVLSTLTSGNASAFLYWWGASSSTANSGLIRLQGDSYQTSSRFWALAAFSRFIRPGAVRIGATSADPGITTAAFRNTGGPVVAEMLNTTTSAVTTDLDLHGLPAHGTAREYLTNGSDSLTQTAAAPAGPRMAVQLPARSLVTVIITP